MVGVGTPTLRQLRSAILGSVDSAAAVAALRESGYAGGGAVFAAFEQWLSESGDARGVDLREMALDRFGERTTQFFRDAGWGEVTFSPDETEDVAIVDIDDCWEAVRSSAGRQGAEDFPDGHGCQITTGLLAAFFGRIAGYPVAVLEVECAGVDASRCRFLLGNAEVMNYKWEEMR
jgi:hypothetical protein